MCYDVFVEQGLHSCAHGEITSARPESWVVTRRIVIPVYK